MNTVEPIRDTKKIEEVKNYLEKRNEKYALMFTLGINTGLRVSDLLKLTAGDVAGSYIYIVEQKTGKAKRFLINKPLRQTLDHYIAKKGLTEQDYLIQSQKGENKPLSRVQAYVVLRQAATACRIETPIGTHTMRKTFGYWHYKQHRDVALLQQIFGHSSPSITLRYIGINDDIIDQSLEDFFL